MTDVVEPFELRRLVVKWNRGPSGGTSEDQDVSTFHLAKIVGGAIDAGWTDANMAAVEALFDTYWGAIRSQYRSYVTLAEFRWFKDGPVFAPADRADGPANPSIRTTARSTAATGTVSFGLPPQVALSITEVTSERKRWGRYYLPAPTTDVLDVDGRIGASYVANNVANAVTFYNGCRSAGFRPVVFSRGRSAHSSRRSGTIPAHAATAYEVLSIQVDNLWDVIQSRRYDGPTLRTRTVLT